MAATFRWDGGRATWLARRVIADGMEEAARKLVWHIKANLQTPYPPASLPGEFPHKRTGNLRRSIDYWLNKKTLSVYVGPNEDAPYGLYLEEGTSRMKKRPYLEPTLKQYAPKIESIVGTFSRRAFRLHPNK